MRTTSSRIPDRAEIGYSWFMVAAAWCLFLLASGWCLFWVGAMLSRGHALAIAIGLLVLVLAPVLLLPCLPGLLHPLKHRGPVLVMDLEGVIVNGVPGAYHQAYNDTHGTHVVGTIAAARDGGTAVTNFHGVAFNATVLVGNTRKTDAVLFGIPQASQTTAQTLDQGHVADVYRGVAAQGVRVLGTSWGSQPNTEQYQTLLPTTGTNLSGRAGLFGSWAFLASEGS